MSRAIRCNRCGAMFDPYELGKRKFVRFRNPAFEDGDSARDNKVLHYLIAGKPDDIVDLCPDCTEDFECFMENYPLSIRTLNPNEVYHVEVRTVGTPYIFRSPSIKTSL